MPACILAIDCATGPTSVAVWKDGSVAVCLEDPASSLQSARLMPMIEQTLKQSAIGYNDLTAVACTTGPGSFTGIRVALAAARGICFAAKIKGLGFTTLEVLAFAASQHRAKKVLAALNAGKGEWYFQAFDGMKPLFEPKVGVPEMALASIAKGDAVVGNVPAPGYAIIPVTFPRADALAALAAMQAAASALTPFYIRPPDAIPAGSNF